MSCEIGNAITSWFAALARDALRPLLTLAGETLLSSPQAGAIPAVHAMWATSLAIADSACVLLVLIGGVIVMGHETLQTSYSAKDIAPRLVTGFLAANLSLVLISRATTIANALSAALAGDGVTPATAASALLGTLTAPLPGGGIFLVLLALAGAVLALVLAVVYVLRLMALVLLTAAAPLALAALRAAADRVGGPLVVAGADRVPGHPGSPGAGADRGGAGVLLRRVDPPARHQHGSVLPVLTAICLLYIMMRIPWWVSRPVLSAFGPSPIRRTVKFAFYAAVLSRVSPLLRGAAGARRPRLRRGRPGPRAGRATRRRRATRGRPARARCTARRRAGNRARPASTGPGRGQPGGSGPGRSQAAPGAAAGGGPGPRRGPGGPGAPSRGPGGSPRPRPPAPGRAAARPGPAPQQRARPPGQAPPAAARHAAAPSRAAARPARPAALRGDPGAAQRGTRPPAGPGPRPPALCLAAAGHARPSPSPPPASAPPPARPPGRRAAAPRPARHLPPPVPRTPGR